MKDYKFIDAIGDIDEDLIAQAMEYKPKKTVKLRFIALAACLAVIMMVLAVFLILDRDDKEDALEVTDTTTSKEDTVPKPDERIVVYYEDYIVPVTRDPNVTQSDVSAYLERDNARFKKSFLLTDIGNLQAIQVIGQTNINPEHLEIDLFGVKYVLEYSSSYRLPLSETVDDDLKKNAFYDVYRTVNNKVEIYYRPYTNEIIRYVFNGIEGTDYKVPIIALTEDELVQKSIAYISQMYGAEYPDNYVYRGFTPINNLTNNKEYDLIFERLVHGYGSGDTIRINLFPDGTLHSMSFSCMGIYDKTQEVVSKESIEKAYEFLKETIEDERLTVKEGSTKVFMNYDGSYYLKVSFTVKDKSYATLGYYVKLDEFK